MVHIGSKFIHLAATNSTHGGHFNTDPLMTRQIRTHWTLYQQYMNTQKQWLAGLMDKSKHDTWARTGKSFTGSEFQVGTRIQVRKFLNAKWDPAKGMPYHEHSS